MKEERNLEHIDYNTANLFSLGTNKNVKPVSHPRRRGQLIVCVYFLLNTKIEFRLLYAVTQIFVL